MAFISPYQLWGKWKNVVTTDVAMFLLEVDSSTSCLLRSNQCDIPEQTKVCKRNAFAIRFMVSYYDNTSLIMNNKGVNVNAKYCKDKVLRPFLKKDMPVTFSWKKDNIIYYQDSATSHTARMTINFPKKRKVNYKTLAEWFPKSPDAASMGYTET